jgi:hypothetical protein
MLNQLEVPKFKNIIDPQVMPRFCSGTKTLAHFVLASTTFSKFLVFAVGFRRLPRCSFCNLAIAILVAGRRL